MKLEKKSKLNSVSLDSPEFFKNSFLKTFLLLLKTNSFKIQEKRQQFNPRPLWKKFQEEYTNNNFVVNGQNFLTVIRFSLVYNFFPLWFFKPLIETVFSTFLWEFTIKKTQLLTDNHRIRVRSTVMKSFFDLKTILSLIPFVFGLLTFLSKKSAVELKYSFFTTNLPGLSVPNEKLNWDTVHYFLKPTLQKKEYLEKTVQSFYQQNFLFLNTNVFEDALRQKIFINTFKQDQVNSFELLSDFYFSTEENYLLIFQNLDELPLYLESLFPKLESNQKSFLKLPLLEIQNFNFLNTSSNVESKNEPFQPQIPPSSLKTVGKILSQNNNFSKKFLALNKSPQKKHVFSQRVEKNLQTLIQTNSFLTLQKNFHDLWQNFQLELRTLYVKQTLNLESVSEETLSSILQESDLKDLVSRNQNIFQEVFSELIQKELQKNPYQTRLMSGYRYPDMTSQEINRLFLPQKITSFVNPIQAVQNSQKRRSFGSKFMNLEEQGFKPNFPFLDLSRIPQNSFLRIQFPALCVGNTLYEFQIPTFPEFSLLTNSILLKDLESERQSVLFEGPGIILDVTSGGDWVTKILNTEFQSEITQPTKNKQSSDSVFQNLLKTDSTNLRLWFQKHLVTYPGFTNLTKNVFVTESSKVVDPINSKNQEWIKNLPVYYVQPLLDLQSMLPDQRKILPKVSNSNESFFTLNTSLNLPVISDLEWKTYYQKIQASMEKTSVDNKDPSEISDLSCFPIPILQTRIPNLQEQNSTLPQTNSQLSLYDKLDYQIDPTLARFRTATDFSLNTQPFFESILEKENFETTFTSGTYKRIGRNFSSSAFPQTLSLLKQRFFIDNWEPLSLQSWLIVSQLGFSFCVFQVLKNLASDYGRELLGYLLELVAATGYVDPEMQRQIETLMGNREQGFRIFLKSSKKFSDVVGIEPLLPQIGELVWFLRNSARNFSFSQTLPRGILFTGPPGTGKTLLVQALAGEAGVPVVALSGSSLVEPSDSAAYKLEMAFQEARQLAPCILFIDEIDTLAQKRENVMQQPLSGEEMDDIYELLSHSITLRPSKLPLNQFQISINGDNNLDDDDIEEFGDSLPSIAPSNVQAQITQQIQTQQGLHRRQLSLLMQLLIELDGMKAREGVIVIGATNRPEILDAAVLRPGRFDRVLQVDLPSDEKRVEIFKFYGQKLGYDDSISWNYFAKRTVGFAAGDIASVMNQSSLKAIVNETQHTLETLEHGINRITTVATRGIRDGQKRSRKMKDVLNRLQNQQVNSSQKQRSLEVESKNNQQNLLTSNRFAYYQASKIICTSLLETHPPVLVAYLWPRRPNVRSVKIAQNLQNYFLRFARRHELEDRIVGCYAGKVGEILFLQKLAFSSWVPEYWIPKTFSKINPFFNINLSTIGLEDLTFGQVLIKFLIENRYLYSSQALTHQMTELAENRNRQEYSEDEEQMAFLNYLGETFECEPRPLRQFLPSPLKKSKTKKNRKSEKQKRIPIAQHYFSIPWWQKQISSEFEFEPGEFLMWYRIFMSNPQESELNPDWVPPDDFYHRNSIPEIVSVSKINSPPVINQDNQSLTLFQMPNMTAQQERFVMRWWQQSGDSRWNDLGNISQDYQTHSLVFQSFNKALVLVDQHREVLDVLASKLVRQKILREWDINKILENYQIKTSCLDSTVCPDSDVTSKQSESAVNFRKIKFDEKIVVNSDWGNASIKKTANWIDFGLIVK